MKRTLVSMVTMSLLLAAISASGREPQHFSQELPWTGKPALSNKRTHAGRTWRGWCEATVFPEFVFTGTFEGAIEYLMVESKKYSPDKISVGGFVLRVGEKDTGGRINVRLRGRNALEIIDNLCALTGCNWTLSPYSIVIYRP